MASDYQENEIKFYILDKGGIENRLNDLGATLLQPRTKERNYRFDTVDHKLSANFEVLRLRQDSNRWMTFKKGESSIEGVQIRKEIEISVSDIPAAKLLLEALGFQVFQTYEKYRTVYTLNGTQVMVDELPFGDFVEIEGVDIPAIINTALDLHLKLDLKIDQSYMEIFESLNSGQKIRPGECLFKNCIQDDNELNRINVQPADR